MAQAVVITRFIDADGPHEVGTIVDLPRSTAEEQVSFKTLIDYGVISTKRSDLEKAQPQG